MHELGLAKDVLRKILEASQKLGLKTVKFADVNIGETLISHKEEFMELFGQISKGTPADGVELKITIMPLMAFCKNCRHDFKAKEMKQGCPHCDSSDFKIVSGKEIVIKELK
jgi:hydrogenase nickel incorporation protein HypA/HybF